MCTEICVRKNILFTTELVRNKLNGNITCFNFWPSPLLFEAVINAEAYKQIL